MRAHCTSWRALQYIATWSKHTAQCARWWSATLKLPMGAGTRPIHTAHRVPRCGARWSEPSKLSTLRALWACPTKLFRAFRAHPGAGWADPAKLARCRCVCRCSVCVGRVGGSGMWWVGGQRGKHTEMSVCGCARPYARPRFRRQLCVPDEAGRAAPTKMASVPGTVATHPYDVSMRKCHSQPR